MQETYLVWAKRRSDKEQEVPPERMLIPEHEGGESETIMGFELVAGPFGSDEETNVWLETHSYKFCCDGHGWIGGKPVRKVVFKKKEKS